VIAVNIKGGSDNNIFGAHWTIFAGPHGIDLAKRKQWSSVISTCAAHPLVKIQIHRKGGVADTTIAIVRKSGAEDRGRVKRIEIESKLNESRNWILAEYMKLSDEQLHRPLTESEHDPDNVWNALDHLGHLALVERNFVGMIRRHLSGHENPVGLLADDDGAPRTRQQIMASVHAMTDRYQRDHHSDSLSRVVALTAAARSESLKLLSELSDEQLGQRLEGAPWADGTLGGVIGTNAEHARLHWKWVTEAGLLYVEWSFASDKDVRCGLNALDRECCYLTCGCGLQSVEGFSNELR
jgi:hypothetical protein